MNNHPYQLAFPSSTEELLNMAFQILDSSVERVGEARDKVEGSLNEDETVDNDKVWGLYMLDIHGFPKRLLETIIKTIHSCCLFVNFFT